MERGLRQKSENRFIEFRQSIIRFQNRFVVFPKSIVVFQKSIAELQKSIAELQKSIVVFQKSIIDFRRIIVFPESGRLYITFIESIVVGLFPPIEFPKSIFGNRFSN